DVREIRGSVLVEGLDGLRRLVFFDGEVSTAKPTHGIAGAVLHGDIGDDQLRSSGDGGDWSRARLVGLQLRRGSSLRCLGSRAHSHHRATQQAKRAHRMSPDFTY